MNRIQKIKILFYPVMLFVGIILYFLTSCNESMDRLLTDEYPESGTQARTGHILCIVVDGASGKAVNAAYTTQKAPNIRAMREYGVITFEGLADSQQDKLSTFTNQRGWANLMTGVTNHGVGLEKEPGGQLMPIEELETPSFFQRIKQVDAGKKISLYTTDNSFRQVFGTDTDVSRVEASDRETKDAVLSEITPETDMPSDVIMVQFNGVQQAGESYGFYDMTGEPTAQVVDAIEQIDSYIGEIWTMLEARENYRKENWLIVVTSTYGGVYPLEIEADTYYDDPRLNTFTLFYNYQLVSNVIGRPGTNELTYNYYTPQYWGALEDSYAEVADPTLFEIEAGKSYTVQFMFYSPTKSISWETFLSKTDRHEGSQGWSVRGDGGRVLFIIGGRWVWSSQQSGDPYIGSDGKWHTVTLVFNRETHRILAYVDGNYSTHRDQQEMTLPSDLTSPTFPLRIGYKTGSPQNVNTSFCITNLQFYDVALPADFIQKNHGQTHLETLRNEYWDHLIGYWPCDREEDQQQSILKDYSQYAILHDGKSDMIYQYDDRYWIDGRSQEENLIPVPDESYYYPAIQNVDISFQIMQWLGLSMSGFNFESIGKNWIYTFMQEN